MMRSLLLIGLIAAAPAVGAQQSGQIEITPLENPTFDQNIPQATDRDVVDVAPGAVLRALDKVSGDVVELTLSNGERFEMGLIEIALGECRYPRGNPAGDAFAWVEVSTPSRGTTDFQGWMIASSPALNALDHARYDVWVMRCTNA